MLKTPRRGWGRRHPDSPLASDTEVGTPLHPLTLGEGRRRGCSGRIPNCNPSSDPVGTSTCYEGPRGVPMGTSSRTLAVPGVLRAVRPPHGCGQVSYLHGVAGHVLRPPARQGSQRRGRACERAGGCGGRRGAQTLPGALRAPACCARPGLARPPPSCALGPQRLQDGSRERRGPRLGRRRGGGGAPGGPRGLQPGVGSQFAVRCGAVRCGKRSS